MGYLHAWIVMAAAVAPPPNGSTALTFEDVLKRALEQAPALIDSRAAVREAEGRVSGARALFPENPAVEAAAGRRSDADERDLEVEVSQRLDLAGQRGPRLAAARAGVDRAQAALEVATRAVLADAAADFYRVLHAEERLALARASEDVAVRLLEAAQKRYDAGDLAALDLNLAKMAAGRAGAEVSSATAEGARRRADLRTVIGLRFDEPLALAGDLRHRPSAESPAAAPGSEVRPEMAGAAAERRQAEAELKLGRRSAWPDLDLVARYNREDGTPIVWGGVALSVPLFKRGQEDRAVAAARVERARAAERTAGRVVEIATYSGSDALQARLDAIRTLEARVVPAVEDNETLARRSFEVGQISLAELLLARREGLEARAAYLDALLAAALDAVELRAKAGGLR